MWASKLAYMDLGLGLLGQTKPVITACVVCWQHPEVSYSVTVASKDLYTMLVNPSLLSVKRIGAQCTGGRTYASSTCPLLAATTNWQLSSAALVFKGFLSSAIQACLGE